MNQLEYFEKVVELIKENPKAKVRIIADSDDFNEDFQWCLMSVYGAPKLENLVEINERIYDEDHYDDAIETLMDHNHDKTISDGDLETLAILEYEEIKTPTIVIRLTSDCL